MGDEKQKNKETTTIELSIDSLMNGVSDLVEKGNKRRLLIRNSKGQQIIDIPLTFGVLGGAFLFFLWPFWAILGVVAAVFFRVRVEVARVNLEDDSDVIEARVINSDDDTTVEKAAERIARKAKRVTVDVQDKLSESRLTDNGGEKPKRARIEVEDEDQLDDTN